MGGDNPVYPTILSVLKIVLLPVNIVACPVLLRPDMTAFTRGDNSVSFCRTLVVPDFCLLHFQPPGLSVGEPTTSYTLPDTMLLADLRLFNVLGSQA